MKISEVSDSALLAAQQDSTSALILSTQHDIFYSACPHAKDRQRLPQSFSSDLELQHYELQGLYRRHCIGRFLFL